MNRDIFKLSLTISLGINLQGGYLHYLDSS